MIEKNIFRHQSLVSKNDRTSRNGHKSFILWFTGLSGAGKSTLAHAVERRLYELNCTAFVLDGDNVRHGLCSDLGFSQNDREENIRRIGETAKLFTDSGAIAITAFISPYRSDREKVRELVELGDFIEVFCNCPIDICEQRDVKGLYAMARHGLIPEFTGITSPYEPPTNPELSLNTSLLTMSDCVNQVLNYLKFRELI